eukprot:350692-Chlamydomonas_euryale.AAC.2
MQPVTLSLLLLHGASLLQQMLGRRWLVGQRASNGCANCALEVQFGRHWPTWHWNGQLGCHVGQHMCTWFVSGWPMHQLGAGLANMALAPRLANMALALRLANMALAPRLANMALAPRLASPAPNGRDGHCWTQ